VVKQQTLWYLYPTS